MKNILGKLEGSREDSGRETIFSFAFSKSCYGEIRKALQEEARAKGAVVPSVSGIFHICDCTVYIKITGAWIYLYIYNADKKKRDLCRDAIATNPLLRQ